MSAPLPPQLFVSRSENRRVDHLDREPSSICQACGQSTLKVLRHAGGRPVGHGTYSGAELRQLVLVAAEYFWRDGLAPTLTLVGDRIGYSADGLSRGLIRRGLSWPAIRSDAYRRSFGRFMSGEAV